jgi:hypothetical protein
VCSGTSREVTADVLLIQLLILTRPLLAAVFPRRSAPPTEGGYT